MAIPMDGLRRGRVAIVMIAATACATASGPARQVHSSVHVESQARADSAAPKLFDNRPPAVPASVPQLPDARPPALSQTPERRIKLLEVPPGTPIDQAVTQVATQLGLGVSIDPEVRGTTSGTLRNVTLDSALAELVGRRGYAYQVQASLVRVAPIRMETRTFTLDYMALSRVGTMSTVIQRRFSRGHANALQSGGVNTPAAGANTFGAPDADVLMAQPVADIWQEIRVALTGLLQAGQPMGAGSRSAAATTVTADPPNASASVGSNAATSVAFSDGATLVVSPISGLISVTAMPDKLRAVEAFIDEFQTSVLRQVAIEAKIVEVTLSTAFQFGIDWTQINTDSKYAFTLRSDPTIQTTGNVGSVYYTLSNGPAQIGAVLTALESQGRVTVLSNEKTTALNNQRAIFNVTTDEVFFHVTRTPLLGPNGAVVSFQNQVIPQQISVGVVLDVFPRFLRTTCSRWTFVPRSRTSLASIPSRFRTEPRPRRPSSRAVRVIRSRESAPERRWSSAAWCRRGKRSREAASRFSRTFRSWASCSSAASRSTPAPSWSSFLHRRFSRARRPRAEGVESCTSSSTDLRTSRSR